MKRLLVCIVMILSLTGCTTNDGIDRAMDLRQRILAARKCEFTCEILADYGDTLYSFKLQCIFDAQGNMEFAVTEPQSINGITGKIEGQNGYLTFNDQVLAFPLLADDQLTPVSAPWIFMKSLRSGYIHSAGAQDDLTYVCINDSFDDDALQLDIWLDPNDIPVRAEILYLNRRILTISITDFICSFSSDPA